MSYKSVRKKRAIWRAWYHRTGASARYVQKARRHKLMMKTLVLSLKKGKACGHCGFSNYRALQFHHIRGKKEFELGNASTKSFGKERILKEARKCQILCANCHAIEHFRGKVLE